MINCDAGLAQKFILFFFFSKIVQKNSSKLFCQAMFTQLNVTQQWKRTICNEMDPRNTFLNRKSHYNYIYYMIVFLQSSNTSQTKQCIVKRCMNAWWNEFNKQKECDKHKHQETGYLPLRMRGYRRKRQWRNHLHGCNMQSFIYPNYVIIWNWAKKSWPNQKWQSRHLYKGVLIWSDKGS